jgi:hypothetical protein
MDLRLRLSRPVTAIALTVALLFAAPGCSQRNADYARSSTMERHLDNYVIPKPVDEVWPTARSPDGATKDTLTWKGEVFTWSETAPGKMHTASKTSTEKESSGESHQISTWFECEALAVAGGTQVHYIEWTVTRNFKGKTELGTKRHFKRRVDLELELVKKFDPDAAQRIAVAAELAAANAN